MAELAGWAPRVLAFMLIAISFQGVLVGEQLLESFPDPRIDPETETEEVGPSIFGVQLFTVEVPNLVATAINFTVWPFAFALWMFDLTTLGPLLEVFPGGTSWIVIPIQLFLGAVMLWVIIAVAARVIDALGQVLPFT